MKKQIGLVILAMGLLAGCGSEKDKYEEKPNSFKVMKVAEVDSTELDNRSDMYIYVDEAGNITYTYYNGIAVIPFSQLTWEQIRIYEEKGIKFPEKLLNEKKQTDSK